MKTLSEKLAWLAGIIDGEGSISAHSQGRDRDALPSIKIGNTDPRMLVEIASILESLEVYFTVEKPRRHKPGHKWFTYILVRRITDVQNLLVAVRPWLIVKGVQADVLINAATSNWSSLRSLNRRGGFSDDSPRKFDRLYESPFCASAHRGGQIASDVVGAEERQEHPHQAQPGTAVA